MSEVSKKSGSTDASDSSPKDLNPKRGLSRGGLRALAQQFTHRDHTQGRLLISILVLALPAVLASSGMALFQLFDLRFLGQIGGEAVAAAGATNQTLRQIFQVSAFGLSVAIQMMIAFAIGRAALEEAEHIAGQSFLITSLLALLSIVSVGLFPNFFVSLIVNEEAVPMAEAYARITFFFFAFNIFAQAANGILVGSGDATTPMMIGLLQVPVAIFFEWALAFGHFGFPALGVEGIAYGTAIGGAFSFSMATFILFSGHSRVHLRVQHLRPDWAMLARIGKTMWQPALQMIARSAMIMVFMFLAGRIGSHVQAAYTIGLRIEMIAVMIAFPIANACATLVGQNLGAGNVDRAWRSVYVSAAVEVCILGPGAVALYLFRDAAVAVFTDDPAVAPHASEYLRYVSFILGFWGIYFVAFRALQAAGDMITPMLISLALALGLGAPLAIYLSSQPEYGASGMWIANVVYSTANTLAMLVWLSTGRWTQRASVAGR
jgi:putative MATE family efflux protein